MTTNHAELAAQKFAEYTLQKNAAKDERLRARTLRAEAKTQALKADAFAKRHEATACSKRSLDARLAATQAKMDLEKIIVQAAGDLVARLPPEYASWGIIKTRAYMKLLDLIAKQSKVQSPKLALCTTALKLMHDHATWTDDIFAKLAAIKGMPKELG